MTKKFFIIAGEASGDLLGSKLIAELKLQNSQSEFIGVGGKLMQEQGLISIFPMEELSVMGFFEVVPHLAKILRRIKQTADLIIEEKPDFLITIDSPDFCFRVVKKLQSLVTKKSTRSEQSERMRDLPLSFYLGGEGDGGLRRCIGPKKIHLIAPSVWAYRPKRAEKISKLYDLLLAILPFEPPYFEKYGLKTIFIGNPIIENAPDFSEKKSENLRFRKKYSIAENDVLICVTPGSRSGEVKKIFPEFIGAINLLSQKIPNLKIVIPLTDKTRDLVLEMVQELKVEYFLIEKDEKDSALFATDFALAKSGTNTLEFSLYHIPMLIAYKINFLTHFIVKRMIKIKFANLINLILNKELIPEMLQKNCEAEKIATLLEKLILDKNFAEKQISESAAALKLMGLGSVINPSKKAAQEILKL
jgi:lipid-A-disaccharide synthase